MIQVSNELSINPAMVASVELDNRHYMNGSDVYLVIHMDDGKTHRLRHGYGVDVFKIKSKIEGAR